MIIIGGGIAGVSLGRELSRRGQHVTLLEAEQHLAYHTSGRSAQQLILGYGPPSVRELTDITVSMLESEQRVLPEPVIWPSTFLMVGDDHEVATQAFPGQVRQDATALTEMVPELSKERFTAGSLDTRSVRTRATALIDWLVDDAENLDIRLSERVIDAAYRDGSWHVTTTAGTYTSEIVINAAGAWADPVADIFGVDTLGLEPLRRSAAILEIDTQIHADRPMVLKIGGYYYRYEDDFAILASPQEAEPSVAEDAQPKTADINALIEAIHADTSLRVTRIRSAWTGLRTQAVDGVPVLGFDQQPGFFWLAGQSGYGFQTSLGFAKLAADVLLDDRAGDWVTQQTVTDLAPQRLR